MIKSSKISSHSAYNGNWPHQECVRQGRCSTRRCNMAGSRTCDWGIRNWLKGQTGIEIQCDWDQKLAIVHWADRLSAEISRFLSDSFAYLGSAIEDHDDLDGEDIESEADAGDNGDLPNDGSLPFFALPTLALPSMLGRKMCDELGITCLAEQELHLRNGNGQANDALHGIRLTLADKAVLFRTEVRHAKNQAVNTRAWGKIQSANSVLSRYSMFYKKCCKVIIMLGVDQELLGKYQVLLDGDLK